MYFSLVCILYYMLVSTTCGGVKRILWGAGSAKLATEIYILPDF